MHQHDVTELLHRWRGGEHEVLREIVSLLYEPLRSLAHQRLRRAPLEDSLNTTGLVHEAYLRFVDVAGVSSDSREHFLALGSRVMRGVLVDHARARVAAKRGGGIPVVELHEDTWIAQVDIDRVTELDEALSRLEELDERQRGWSSSAISAVCRWRRSPGRWTSRSRRSSATCGRRAPGSPRTCAAPRDEPRPRSVAACAAAVR